VGEQVGAIEKELVNIWRKYEEVNERARVEERIRRMFQKYVPPTVIDQALKEEVQTGGEAVEVAVLFADLVGFTSFAETTAPDEVMRTVNRYMAAFSESISRHDGSVDKFLGDGIMAVFGAPLPDPDGPSRAVRCAQAILEAAKEVNRQTGRGFQVRIGIHCGPAVAGHVGSPERIAYTVIGDTVNVAARLQAEAKPGGILVSDEVKSRSGGSAVFRACSAIRVRGRSSETRVFELGVAETPPP
jgi:adenylate cyclase